MKKFEGLLYTPASDLNFVSGIQGLKDAQLNEMLERLIELDETESGHKGQIKAVEKEIKNRGGSSTEIVAVEKMQESIEMAEKLYSDGMPYELDRIENEIRFYMAQTAQALFESGKRFLRIKAHESHGAFYAALKRIGVPERTADYAMAVVKKFGPNPHPVADLGSAKLRMLTIFEEEEVKRYIDGGSLGSIPHEDVEKMSKRELQDAIRKEREKHKKDVDTREKAIKQKEEKINKLDEQLRYQQPPTQEQIAQAALQKLNEEYTYTLAKINSNLREAYATVVKAEKIENVNVQQLSDWLGQFDIEMNAFRELNEAWTNEIDNAGPMQDWRISDLPK
jgi:hypothetical protein